MNLQAFTVFDKTAAAYGVPFFAATAAVAQRMFGMEVNRADEKSTIYMYPDDYALYHIGEYDDATGVLTPTQPVKLVEGSVFVKAR